MKKGNALVSFVMLLPVIIILTLAIIDLLTIKKYSIKLEGIANNVEVMYKDNKTIEEIENFIKLNSSETEFKLEVNKEYIKILLVKNVNLLTPGANIMFDDPYEITIYRILNSK